MGPRQSLSEVVGTHVVLACKWVITVFTHNTAPLPLPPPQSMLFKPKHIKPDEEWDTTLNRVRGGLSFVEIQRFCGICPKTFETDCSIPKVVGSIPTVAGHIFQARPVWICTQTNITGIIIIHLSTQHQHRKKSYY